MEPARVPENGGVNPNNSGVPVPATHPSNTELCTIHICPTTGGGFDISVLYQDTIDSIKKTIAKRLKLSKERISLLYKDRILKEGSVLTNGLYEGCRLTLLPHVESGLISQRNENSVMQALENLTESQQVNDFLSGKAPLTLAMRLGDHMMFVQLQLSTSPPGSKHRTTTSSSSRASASSSAASSSQTSSTSSSASARASTTPLSSHSHPVAAATAPSTSASATLAEASSSIISSLPSLLSSRPAKVLPSPIPIKPTPVFPLSPSSTCSSPASSAPSSPATSGFSSGPPSPASSTSSFGSPLPSPLARSPSSSSSASESDGSQPPSPTSPVMPVLDSNALAQASRNLSQKLRELSQASTHTKDSTEDKSSLRSSGAIIESMYHHGQGVFSGTFSGTLNPALQDTDGKPRRSVSTIVHILNDLLGATPQYRARMTPRSRAASQRTHGRSPRSHHYHHHHHHQVPSASSRRSCRGQTGDHTQLNSENKALKGKVQHIQQMLEERRRRLRARRQARSSPYPSCWSGVNRTDTPVSNMTHQPMDVDTSSTSTNGHSDSHSDSASYTQIKQEPVMA